jgi:hypothetical protein
MASLEAWSNFALGELGAASALAGLLFVSISVNQERILELGRMAERGLEALAILFLVIVVTSLMLVPDQPLRLLGVEIAAAAGVALVVLSFLQRAYLAAIEPAYQPRSRQVARFNLLAVALVALTGLVVGWRGDTIGFRLLPLGLLFCFVGVGANAWILLIEIKR